MFNIVSEVRKYIDLKPFRQVLKNKYISFFIDFIPIKTHFSRDFKN